MRLGRGLEEFWRLTPAETAQVFQAERERAERQREHDLWLAWHEAALARVRRLPPLRRVLRPPAAQVLTPEEKVRRAREFAELTARFGAPTATDRNG